jgi:iron complex transport system ATP-binding protein
MSQLQVNNLCVNIGETHVCNNLTLSLEPGQVWGLLGRNGIGKTTLLHTLANLRLPTSGEIRLNDHELTSLPRKEIAKKMGVLLQAVDDPFPSTVLETVLIGRHPYISNWQWESKDDFQSAKAALRRVGLQNFEHRSINQLSGGERQRVALATLLTQDPDIFLLDEPTSHLDLHYQIHLLEELCQYAKRNNRIVFMSLHDINLAARFCDKLLFLLGNGTTKSGTTDELLNSDYLNQLYKHPIQKITNGRNSVYIAD